MSREIRVRATVEVPKVPNFLRMTDGQTLPVSAVEDDDLRRLGGIWIEALIERAHAQRATGAAAREEE